MSRVIALIFFIPQWWLELEYYKHAILAAVHAIVWVANNLHILLMLFNCINKEGIADNSMWTLAFSMFAQKS